MRCTRQNIRFDDNISVPVVMADLASTGVALLPILQNWTVPPVADEQRCDAFGQALGEAIRRQLPDGLQVGLSRDVRAGQLIHHSDKGQRQARVQEARNLRGNAATWGGTLEYRASIAQWKAERQARRPEHTGRPNHRSTPQSNHRSKPRAAPTRTAEPVRWTYGGRPPEAA